MSLCVHQRHWTLGKGPEINQFTTENPTLWGIDGGGGCAVQCSRSRGPGVSVHRDTASARFQTGGRGAAGTRDMLSLQTNKKSCTAVPPAGWKHGLHWNSGGRSRHTHTVILSTSHSLKGLYMVHPFNLSITPVPVHNKWHSIIAHYSTSSTRVHYRSHHRFEARLFLYFIQIQPIKKAIAM